MLEIGPNARTPRDNEKWRLNLTPNDGSRAPAKGNGKIERACQRCLTLLGEATTSVAVNWCYRALGWSELTRHWQRRAVRRAMRCIGAIAIRRAKARGCPIVWGLSKK
jgi:hypothetical protein